jgi:hypothetical protein
LHKAGHLGKLRSLLPYLFRLPDELQDIVYRVHILL